MEHAQLIHIYTLLLLFFSFIRSLTQQSSWWSFVFFIVSLALTILHKYTHTLRKRERERMKENGKCMFAHIHVPIFIFILTMNAAAADFQCVYVCVRVCECLIYIGKFMCNENIRWSASFVRALWLCVYIVVVDLAKTHKLCRFTVTHRCYQSLLVTAIVSLPLSSLYYAGKDWMNHQTMYTCWMQEKKTLTHIQACTVSAWNVVKFNAKHK